MRDIGLDRALGYATAMMHADTLASRYHPAAFLYLELAQAWIEGDAIAIARARERCIVEYEIPAYSTEVARADCTRGLYESAPAEVAR